MKYYAMCLDTGARSERVKRVRSSYFIYIIHIYTQLRVPAVKLNYTYSKLL